MKLDIMPVATEKQVKEIADSASSIWSGYLHKLYSEEKAKFLLNELQSKEAILKKLGQRDYYYMILLVDEKPVGLLSFFFANNAFCIDTLYINEDMRHKGILREVMDYMETFCRLGYPITRVLVHIPLADSENISMFEHLGFHKVGLFEYSFHSSFGMECCTMERIPKPKPEPEQEYDFDFAFESVPDIIMD